MTNVVDAIRDLGTVLAHWPMQADRVTKAAYGGVDMVQTGGGISSAAGPFAGENVAFFDGTQSLSLPGIENFVTGRGAVTVGFWFHLIDSGNNQYFLYNSLGGSGVGFDVYMDTAGRIRAITDATATSQGGAARVLTGYPGTGSVWGAFQMLGGPGVAGVLTQIMYSGTSKVDGITSTFANRGYDWTGAATMGIAGINSKIINGSMCHLVLWDGLVPFNVGNVDIPLIDTPGVWCFADIDDPTPGSFKIDTTDVTATTTWDYWVHSITNPRRLYARGSDFTIVAGVSTTPVYLPVTGTYLLTLRDQTTGKAHSQPVQFNTL